MKTCIPSLALTSTSLALGLCAVIGNPAEAATWSRTINTSFKDTYSDTNAPTTNLGNSRFINIGNAPRGFGSGSEQIGYFGWDLQSVIDEINNLSPTAIVRNLRASVILTQTTENPNNPNDFDQFGPIDRTFEQFARVSISAYEVTGPWSESAAINPNNPPATNSLSPLFFGDIFLGSNIYRGTGLNQLLTSYLNQDLSTVSIAIKPSDSFNFPDFGFFPVDTFLSHNQNDPSQVPKLELSFELWDEAYKTDGGSDFKMQARAGGQGGTDYEAAILDVDRSFNPRLNEKKEWNWSNGTPTTFELSCNPNTNLVTLTLFSNANNANNQVIQYTANTCQDIDGLKIFSSVQEVENLVSSGTTMEMRVNQVRQIGGNLQNVPGLSAKGTAGGTQLVEDFFYFTDSVANGGLGFTQGVEFVRGTMTLAWPNGARNPQLKNENNNVARSNAQVQLIPFTRHPDPLAPQEIVPLEEVPAETTPSGLGPSSLTSDELAELLGFDENSPEVDAPSVPEPSSMISLILLGTVGAGLKLRQKRKS